MQPVDTPYGRKTMIHQTSCNYDFSCLRGDCPSFATVTVDGDAATRKPKSMPKPPDPDALPDPVPVVDPDRFTVRLSGIGGTGVITVSQIIGTAAMFDGFEVRGLDQTGLSQKAGPVTSDIRVLARHGGGVEPRRGRRHRRDAGVRHARRRQRPPPRGRRTRPHGGDRIARGRADRAHGHQSGQRLLPR